MIIALTGYGQSGKDSVGRMLVEHHGFTRVAFADKLKELALKLSPFLSVDLAYMVQRMGWDAAKSNQMVREFLQGLGVACREVLGPDVWATAVVNQIYDADPEGNYVVTDVRFLNEAAQLRNQFTRVRVVRIQRPGFGPLNGHVSETELDQIRCDHVLLNDGDLYDLERKVRSLVIDDTVHVPSS